MPAAPKILVIRFSSIGDIVLTTPVVRVLKSQLNAEVHFCTKTKFASLLTENPYIDRLHLLNDSDKPSQHKPQPATAEQQGQQQYNSLGSLAKALRAEKFTAVIDLHNNLRTRLLQPQVQLLGGSKWYRFDKLNFEKWLYTRFKIDRLPRVHIVDRYLAAAAPLGIKNDTLGLDYFIPEKDELPAEWLPEGFRQRFVALVIGGAHYTKRLPIEKLIELTDKINKPVVILGGPEDADVGEQLVQFFKPGSAAAEEELADRLNKRATVFNACGKLNLNQSASVVRQAQAVFTNDTGLMHIAAAFGKQIFSIWGNTTPLFGMYPYRTKFTVFENNKLSCRPCSKIGYPKCPKGHFECMRKQNFDFYLP